MYVILDATDPLAQELEHLRDGLRAIKEEQQYIIVRERVHRNSKITHGILISSFSFVASFSC